MSSGGVHPHPEALYYHIALDAVTKADLTHDEFERKQHVASGLVFAALCLEAFINQQYAANAQTKKIFEENDKIPLELKWLMLPLLLRSASTFEKGSEPFQTFHSVVQTRNQRLVHFKPHRETQETDQECKSQYFGDLLMDVAYAKSCVDCIAKMIHELNRLTDGATELPNFLKGSKYLSSVWSNTTIPIEWQGPNGT